MTLTDPIADMLTRIRNAGTAHQETVLVSASKLRLSLARILKAEGFIKDVEVVHGRPQQMLKITLITRGRKEPMIRGLKRFSKPGLRAYVGKDEIPRVYGNLGITILSTPKGVMTGREAHRQGVGGEVLCLVW